MASRQLERELARQINYLEKHQPGAVRQARQDGWTNVVNGLGVQGRDKRSGTLFYANDMLQEDELNAIYCHEGIGKRIVDIWTEDMTRKFFEVSGDTDGSFHKAVKKFGGRKAIVEGVRWSLLHGGAVGIIGIDDGGVYEEPVNEGRIRAITHIHVFDRWRAVWTTADLYLDPESPKFATPEYYTIFPINPATVGSMQQWNSGPRSGGDMAPRASGVKGKLAPAIGAFRVHESRILRFDGMPLPLKNRIQNRYWNASVLQSLYERVKGLGESFANLELIISEFVQGVMTVDGLAGMIGTKGEDQLKARLQLMDMTSHVLNTRIIDKEEEYKKESTTATGLGDLMDRLMLGISSASSIPEMVLFGKSVGGLGSNDESNLRRYYDKVASMQTMVLEEPAERLVRYMQLSEENKIEGLEGDDENDWVIEFPSLWALSEKEEVAIRAQMATADTAYINNGVITPEEVTKSRFGGEQYSYDTKLSDERDEDGFLPVPEPDPNAPLDANGQPGSDLDGQAGVSDTPDGVPEEGYLAQYAKMDADEKGNPNHSSENGQFASGGGSSHKSEEPSAGIRSKKIMHPPKEKLAGKINMDKVREYVEKHGLTGSEVENPANVPSDEVMAKLTESKLVADDGYATTKEAGEALSKGKYQKILADKVSSIQGHVFGDKLVSMAHALNRGSFTPSGAVKGAGPNSAPIMAYKVGDEYVLVDGNHRFAALKLSGHTEMHAFVAEVKDIKKDAWTEEARKKSAEARKNGAFGKTWEELSPEQRALHMKMSGTNAHKLSFTERAKIHEEMGAHLSKLAKAKTDAEKQTHARNAATAAIKAHGKAPDKKAVGHVSSRLVSSGGGKGNLMSIVKKYYGEVEKETNPND